MPLVEFPIAWHKLPSMLKFPPSNIMGVSLFARDVIALALQIGTFGFVGGCLTSHNT